MLDLTAHMLCLKFECISLFSVSKAPIGFNLVLYSMKIKWANSLNSLKLQNPSSLQIVGTILQHSAKVSNLSALQIHDYTRLVWH